MKVWLWSAAALLLALLPCGVCVFRGSPAGRLAGLEMTGVIVTIELILLAQGFHRVPFYDLYPDGRHPLLRRRAGLRTIPGEVAMTVHAIIVAVLLGLAVLLAIVCSIGVAVMPDALQRLHFPAIVVSICMALIIAAVWYDERDWQARIKVMLVGLVLFVMNAVLTNATAKAVRVWRVGHWEAQPEEGIPVVGRGEIAGQREREQETRA